MGIISEIYQLFAVNAPKPFIVDREFVGKLAIFKWKYVPRNRMARATVEEKMPREFLHRYIAKLANKEW